MIILAFWLIVAVMTMISAAAVAYYVLKLALAVLQFAFSSPAAFLFVSGVALWALVTGPLRM